MSGKNFKLPKPPKGRGVTETTEDTVPQVKDEVIAYQPFPGPQTEFLKSIEDYVLFSGGRGSGKSLAMLAIPLRFVHLKEFRGLVIRKTIKDLRDLVNKAKAMYMAAIPGTKWKEQDKMFVFPSGAVLEFNYFELEKDADQYQGQEFDFIGIDEITQYSTSYIMETLIPCLRGNTHIPKWFRATTNPNGAGRGWVKETWVDKAPSGERITEYVEFDGEQYPITLKWFQSSVRDNPELMKQGYGRSLANIKNETLRRQWRDGDWESADGLAFDEFREALHVVKPFEIPQSWTKFRACDWGYGSMASCLWFAVDYDNKIYVYRELIANHTGPKVKADAFARRVLELEERENVSYGMLDSSTWAKRGELGESVAETMLNEGCRWRPSDRSKGSRIAGKMLIHNYLQGTIAEEQKPNIFFFDTCKEIIKELSSLPLCPNNPEDVDTKACDHAYDALRYGLSSRPIFKSKDFFDDGLDFTQPIIDIKFGY